MYIIVMVVGSIPLPTPPVPLPKYLQQSGDIVLYYEA